MDYSFLWFAIASGAIIVLIFAARARNPNYAWEFAAFCSMWCLGASILVLLASV